MARIAGINIPTNKKVFTGLTYIKGIGPKIASDICKQANIPSERRVNELTDSEVIQIREIIEGNYKVEGELRREVSTNIKRLMVLNQFFQWLLRKEFVQKARTLEMLTRDKSKEPPTPTPAERNMVETELNKLVVKWGSRCIF